MIFSAATAAALEPWLAKGFHDLPFETYVALEAANSHGLMDMRRSPAFYQWRKANRKPPSKALDFGGLAHQLVLEPELLEKTLVVHPKFDLRTKAGKEGNAKFQAQLKPGQRAIGADVHEKLLRVRDRLVVHPWVKRILGRGKNEQVACWVHNQTQVFCKARFDKVLEQEGWIVDLKTCTNAHPRAFQRQLVNFDYDLQSAFYWDAFAYVQKRPPQGYLFVCIESEAPFDVAIYSPEPTVLEHGRWKYTKALMEFEDCVKTGVWPGYPEKAVPIELPGWAAYQEAEE